MTQRLDIALVSRGLFASRAKAQEAISAGIVAVNGEVATKPSLKVAESDDLAVVGETLRYVSRAGLKLEHAIEAFGVCVAGRTLLDIGSSTGGFTDCALQHGAAGSFAVDVGRDQLAPSLRADSRVTVLEGTDIRDLRPELVSAADIASIDVSFISVTKIADIFDAMPNLTEVICLIKPQFECGKSVARRTKGVPLDRAVHVQAIEDVLAAFAEHGFGCTGLAASPVRGQSGNIEYLARFMRGAADDHPEFTTLVASTFTAFGV